MLAADSTVRGLVINGWTGGGISLLGSNNTIECSVIGTDRSGTFDVPNFIGVSIVHATGDLDGVALASIQGLYQIVQEQDAQLTQQQAQINELLARLIALEQNANATP